jgi:hypothetical protein
MQLANGVSSLVYTVVIPIAVIALTLVLLRPTSQGTFRRRQRRAKHRRPVPTSLRFDCGADQAPAILGRR